MAPTFHEALPSSDALLSFDLLVIDADNGTVAAPRYAIAEIARPKIALVGSEAPSRLQWALSQEVTAHLQKPIRSQGLFSTIVFARERHAQLVGAESRAQGRRFVVSAQIALIRELAIDEASSFRCLRNLAMNTHKTIEQVSVELLADPELRTRPRLQAHLDFQAPGDGRSGPSGSAVAPLRARR
ncbi:ANTAR domain-containing response regulator [Hansschlegelia plantiphila]|nr:hypothetical protein [Hansschlegelia plantiphila]